MAQSDTPDPKMSSRRSRPLLVADAIKDWVVERGLQPGDRRPGEAELIERIGMSKGTIREVMPLLQAREAMQSRMEMACRLMDAREAQVMKRFIAA